MKTNQFQEINFKKCGSRSVKQKIRDMIFPGWTIQAKQSAATLFKTCHGQQLSLFCFCQEQQYGISSIKSSLSHLPHYPIPIKKYSKPWTTEQKFGYGKARLSGIMITLEK